MLDALFPDVIGQEGAKSQIAFHLEGYQATGVLPHLLLAAEKGGGKTLLARCLGSQLKSKSTNQPRRFLELNCSSIENNTHFFDSFVLPYMQGGQELTVFFDECSELPMATQMALLSICETKKEPVTKYFWNGTDILFDFRNISFIFATTEAQKVFHALKNRLEKVEFDKYSKDELGKIVSLAFTKKVKLENGVLDEVAVCARANPRTATLLGKKINGFLLARNKKDFCIRDWREIQHRLRIYPLGLSTTEVQLLRALTTYKQTPLKQLAAKLGMTPEMVQRDVELNLVREDLVNIEARGRVLSGKGLTYINQLSNLGL